MASSLLFDLSIASEWPQPGAESLREAWKARPEHLEQSGLGRGSGMGCRAEVNPALRVWGAMSETYS